MRRRLARAGAPRGKLAKNLESSTVGSRNQRKENTNFKNRQLKMAERLLRRTMLVATLLLTWAIVCMGSNSYYGGGNGYGRNNGNYGGNNAGSYGSNYGSGSYGSNYAGSYGGNDYRSYGNNYGGNYANNGNAAQENYDQNQYTYNNDGNGGKANQGYNSGYEYSSSVQLSVCEDSVVEATYLEVACDSPYTFYYGNGANRDSPVCDYGDKATISGTVTVVDDLQYGDPVYVSMAIYDNGNHLLTTSSPVNFCNKFVKSDCTLKGTYDFVTTVKLGTPDSGDSSQFTPLIQMAFSTRSDYGYNLGAVNTLCKKWDKENPEYLHWGNSATARSPFVSFLADNGMLIGTCVSLALFAVFIWKRAYDEKPADLTIDERKEGLVSLD